MKKTFDALAFLADTLSRHVWSRRQREKYQQITPIGLQIRWREHHDRGWYYYLLENDIEKAKQEFYVCGLLDEATNKMVGDKTVSELGQNHYNSNSLGGMTHFADALCCDNKALIDRRIKLTFPEHEQYVFKDKYDQSIIVDLLYSLLRDDSERVKRLHTLLPGSRNAADFVFDRLYIDGLLEGNEQKMQKGIEGVASLKVHKRRQTQVEHKLAFQWDNVVLSHYGIVYAKIAWMRGYELDIQAPLVRVTKDLWPVNPLVIYDSVYDFLQPG